MEIATHTGLESLKPECFKQEAYDEKILYRLSFYPSIFNQLCP